MQVYSHHSTSPLLRHALKATLPHSITLTYRTQHASQTPDAHILATFPPSEASSPKSPTSAQNLPKCWAAAYLDRSMRPETELWIFAAGEIPGHYEAKEGGLCPRCAEAVLALVEHMATLPVPPLHPDNLPALELAKQHVRTEDAKAKSYYTHLLEPAVVTLGACHVQVVKVLSDAYLVREEFPGLDTGLNKFWFKISDLPQGRELPDELRWGTMGKEDVEIVKARTAIPRTTRTMLAQESVGVFEKETGRPVAWTFLSYDGSLASLHTELEWRGRGIAKAVATKIMREHGREVAVDEQGNAWSHADVYVGNVQSESVCRSLGGKPSVQILWVRVDIGGGRSSS